MKSPIEISVIIKSLNEEKNIGATITSCLNATKKFNSEIILADSASTDDTIAIALKYPIKIVQLKNPNERCCGIGAQLGYLNSNGSYLFIIDADMLIHEQFLMDAIRFLNMNPDVAGVAGIVVEKNLTSMEFKARVLRSPKNLKPGYVDRLDGGGLYRRSAIEEIGYLTNRNLHAYEEFDLAARLRSVGWKLYRLSTPSVDHYGYSTSAYTLLIRRWKTKYIFGIGEIIRSSIGKKHFPLVISDLQEIRIYILTIAWSCLLFILAIKSIYNLDIFLLFLATLVTPPTIMSIKKSSIKLGIYAVTSWLFHSAGLLVGLTKKCTDPTSHISTRIIK